MIQNAIPIKNLTVSLLTSRTSSKRPQRATRRAFAKGLYCVKPTNFCTNTEALADNKFMSQNVDTQDSEDFKMKIKEEHDSFVRNMRAADIKVTEIVQQSDDAPDAIFPDWFTTYKGESVPEGVLIIHPMKYASRRNERIPGLIAKWLDRDYRYIIDLTHFEKRGLALEGKGSIVFDHRNRIFYCALSDRCHQEVVDELVHRFNSIAVDGLTNPYRAITFEAFDQRGDCIYHTDCMMSLHAKHAFICTDAIRNLSQRAEVVSSLTSGRYSMEIFELTQGQIEQMSANAQSIVNDNGENCIVQSKRGFEALTLEQRDLLNREYKMVISDVETIESVGGGSCRCMVVENWSTVENPQVLDRACRLIDARASRRRRPDRRPSPQIHGHSGKHCLNHGHPVVKKKNQSPR